MAFAVGLFWAFIPVPPVPGQMFFSALTAIWLRVNLPISVALVWLTNPITMPPVFYGAYKLGEWLLDLPPAHVDFELTSEWFSTVLFTIWKPFLLGCVVIAITASLLGYWVVQLLWRLLVLRDYRARQRLRVLRRGSRTVMAGDGAKFDPTATTSAVTVAEASHPRGDRSDRAAAPKPDHA